MKTFKKYFLLPTIFTIIALICVYIFGNMQYLFSVVILIALEITLSFDNAVVNAKVLEKMNALWRKRFLNWGLWFAVFGTRVILPLIIVALVSQLSVFSVLYLAIFDSVTYASKLAEAHYSIGAFGGVFLLLTALKFFFDSEKEIHWIKKLESNLKKYSSIESIEIMLALIVLLVISLFEKANSAEILFSGIVGCIVFVLMNSITSKMESGFADTAKVGFSLFLYLNVLDIAFSLDGVIGAFAISKNLFVIATGLGIGAYFVKSFTLLLVDKNSLKELKYLEHGAHYAIFGLALCMLLGLIFHIPELVTGLIGLFFVFSSYISSVRR